MSLYARLMLLYVTLFSLCIGLAYVASYVVGYDCFAQHCLAYVAR